MWWPEDVFFSSLIGSVSSAKQEAKALVKRNKKLLWKMCDLVTSEAGRKECHLSGNTE